MSGALAMGNQNITNAGTIEANILQDNDDATISINDNLDVAGGITLSGEIQADKVCVLGNSFAITGVAATNYCPDGYCVEAIVDSATKQVMASGYYNTRGVTQFVNGKLLCCRCSSP